MINPNKPNVKSEIPKSPEKTELQPDRAMEKEAQNFFNQKIIFQRRNLLSEDQSVEDLKEGEHAIDRYEDWKRELSHFFRANPKTAEIYQQEPGKVAGSLGSIAGFMTANRPEILSAEMDEDIKKKFQDTHEASKKIFMEGCKRLYPDVKSRSVATWESRLKDISKDLRDEGTKAGIKIVTEQVKNYYRNPGGLLRYLDGAIVQLSRRVEGVAWQEGAEGFDGEMMELSEEIKNEMAEQNKAIYELQLMRENVAEKVREREDKKKRADKREEEADQIRTIKAGMGIPAKEKSQEKLKDNLEDIENRYRDSSIRNLDGIKKVFKEEDKEVILEEILKGIDFRIGQGKMINAKTPGSAVEARGFANIMGPGEHHRRIYQFPACVREGKMVYPDTIGRMRMDEYLKKYFGYDIHNDEKRKADLDRYTNMLDK